MEIEVKARVTNEKEAERKLVALGCVFSNPMTQVDTVWTKEAGTLEIFLSNLVFLRIRVQNGSKVFLTAKKPKVKHGHESLVKHEYEVAVDSEDEARGILTLMGFHQAVRVEKQRRIATHGGYEICLDAVKSLGTFIEMEKMGEESEAAKIQGEMLRFLRELGISEGNVVKKGYDILMLEKNS